MIRRIFFTLTVVIVALALVACGPEPAEDVAAIPTRTPRPTFTPTPVQVAAPVEQPATATSEPQAAPAGESQVVADPPEAAPTEAQSPTPEPPTPTPQPQEAIAVVNSPQVNLRTGPGTGHALAGSVERGAELPIVGKNTAGDWWQVDFNGQTVWIAGFLVDTTGPVDSVAVAADIPALPPTPTPQPVAVQPTAPPAAPAPTEAPAPAEPTAAPAPGFTIAKEDFVEPRPNSNPYITFFGWICKTTCPSTSVAGYKMVVEGPAGHFETNFEPNTLVGDPGLGSEFWYNAKLEIPSTAPGAYRVWVADPGGNQVAEAWEYTVEGDHTHLLAPLGSTIEMVVIRE